MLNQVIAMRDQRSTILSPPRFEDLKVRELAAKGAARSKSASTSSETVQSTPSVSLSTRAIVAICILGLTPGLVVSALVAVFLRMEQQMDVPRDSTLAKAPPPGPAPVVPYSPPSPTTTVAPLPTQENLVCQSEDCNYMSEKLRATLNFSVNPCDDFYQYVCGNMDEPDDVPFLLIRDAVQPTIVSHLYTESVPPTNQTAWQKAARMFKACFKLGKERRSEVDDLKQWMISLNLDLATLTPAEPYNSIDLMVRCSLHYGMSPLFEFEVSKLAFTAGKRSLRLRLSESDVSWLDLRKRRKDDVGPKAQQELYLSYLILYTTNITELKPMYSTVFSLDDQMSQQMSPYIGTGDKIVPYKLRDLAHFTTPLAESDQWDSMIAQYTYGVYNGGDYLLFNQSTVLILQNVVTYVNSEGMRFLIAWSVFRQGLERALPGRFAAEYKKTIEQVCYDDVKDVMESALTSGYLSAACGMATASFIPRCIDLTKASQSYLVSMQALREAKEMVRRLADALRRSLETSQWLEGNSRVVALKKLENMAANVGHPAQLHHSAQLEEHYSTYNDSTNRFFTTWLRARVAYQHRLLIDNVTYFFDPVAVNAFYARWANLIIIPAAILQPEIYFSNGPSSAAYGSLGQAIGHEIMHGFDVRGFAYDENNKFRSWATPEAEQHYVNEALCLRESHKRAQMHIEPQSRQDMLNDTLDSENIADFGGTLMAFGAFDSLPPSQRDVVLPAVDLSARQLFFVFQCAKWCYYAGSKSRRHAAGRYRCAVPAMNMDEFAEAFLCKSGDRMHPENKCALW